MAISANLGEQREARVGQETIRYRERGDGAPIVFVHGALVNGDLWRKVVPGLAEGHRCIVPDWPLGSHEVPIRDKSVLKPLGLARLMADFIGELGLDDPTVVGNDTGGGLSQILAAEHPERVGSLVLTSCDAFNNFPPHAFKPLQPLLYVPGAGRLVVASARPMAVRRAFFKPVAKRPIPDEILDSYLGPALRDAAIRRDLVPMVRGLRPKYTRRAAEKLRWFQKPALIAWSADDGLFPVRHGRRLAELIPNARFELIEDARAFSPEDQPERLAELIGDFVRGRGTRAAGAAA